MRASQLRNRPLPQGLARRNGRKGMAEGRRVKPMPGPWIDFHSHYVPIRLNRVAPAGAARRRRPVIRASNEDRGVSLEHRCGWLATGIVRDWRGERGPLGRTGHRIEAGMRLNFGRGRYETHQELRRYFGAPYCHGS
jgi:hypothetical protein